MDESTPKQHDNDLDGMPENLTVDDIPMASDGESKYGFDGKVEYILTDSASDALAAYPILGQDGLEVTPTPAVQEGSKEQGRRVLVASEQELFTTDALALFLDKSTVDQERRKAAHNGDTALAEEIAETQLKVEQGIFGPEQMVMVAKEGRTQIGTEFAGRVEALATVYEDIGKQVGAGENFSPYGNNGEDFTEFLRMVPDAIQKLEEINDQARGGKATKEQIEVVGNLSMLVAAYNEAKQRASKRSDTVVTLAVQGQEQIKTDRTNLSERQSSLINQVSYQRALPSQEYMPQTIDAVVRRGAKSIVEHQRSCDAECSSEQSKISAVNAELSSMRIDANNVFQTAKLLEDIGKDMLPAETLERQISDLQETILQQVGRDPEHVRTGSVMNVLHELQSQLVRLRTLAVQFDTDQQRLGRQVATLRKDIVALKGRPLFRSDADQAAHSYPSGGHASVSEAFGG